MKKLIICFLTAIMLLTAGCNAQKEEPTEASTPLETTPFSTESPTDFPTEAATESVPECVNAIVQVDEAPAILELLNRGDIVDIVGEYDEDHYVIKRETGYGLVEKQLLRISGEDSYESWVGYATSKAELYSNYQLMGAIQANLNINTQVEVLEELKFCYVVKVGEVTGFIAKEQVSRNYIKYSGGSSSGADGGDISLKVGGVVPLSAIDQSGEVTGVATVLADGTEVVLCYYERDELASVVLDEGFAPERDGYYTVYLNGMYAYLPEKLALLEGDESYAKWDGYAGNGAVVFNNRLLQGEGTQIGVNTVMTVLWDGGDFYVVSINGEVGYIALDKVGQDRFATGGGGGSSGGDWTPPAM